VDRFNLVLDVLDRVPRLQGRTAHLREDMRNAIILNINYAHEHGTDSPEISEWVWPY
jgi:xylulose-5-phosphate/fructose-6-phosphate phosphoketolase